jgi:site-specific DNA-methyltransferase (adenine-specific)
MDKSKSKVYNMDCMEYMKDIEDNYFELAIVDPPYGIGETRHCKKHKKIDWNDKYPDEKYFEELYRISKNRIIWGCNYYIGMIKDAGRIIHNKLGVNIGRRLTSPTCSDCDLASHSFNNLIKMFSYTWIGNVQGNDYKVLWSNTGKIHPQQKPVELYKWVLKNYAKEGDKIFDSHLGSGSSRIAAYELGFDFTGCEIDKDYFNDQELRFMEFKKKHHNNFYIPKENNLLFKDF